MLCREANGLAQPQPPGLDHPGIGGRALGLVRRKDHVIRPLAQNLGENLIHRRHPGARVDHEEADIGHLDRALGQPPHPAFKAVIGGILQPRRVDHRKAQIAQPRVALAQVAGHTGLVIDQRQALAHKAVEERGLAHIGAAHDGESERHGIRLRSGVKPV